MYQKYIEINNGNITAGIDFFEYTGYNPFFFLMAIA